MEFKSKVAGSIRSGLRAEIKRGESAVQHLSPAWRVRPHMAAVRVSAPVDWETSTVHVHACCQSRGDGERRENDCGETYPVGGCFFSLLFVSHWWVCTASGNKKIRWKFWKEKRRTIWPLVPNSRGIGKEEKWMTSVEARVSLLRLPWQNARD